VGCANVYSTDNPFGSVFIYSTPSQAPIFVKRS